MRLRLPLLISAQAENEELLVEADAGTPEVDPVVSNLVRRTELYAERCKYITVSSSVLITLTPWGSFASSYYSLGKEFPRM